MYSVLICDMFHYMEPDHQLQIDGFTTLEMVIRQITAAEFARRRVRDSLEELRKPGQSREELRHLWFTFGEDAIIAGAERSYRGLSELDFFIDHPASPQERDWTPLCPG